MSDFKFKCPHCQQSLEAPEEMLGTAINCPTCNGSIQLPAAQQPPELPPATKRVVITKTATSPSANTAPSQSTQKEEVIAKTTEALKTAAGAMDTIARYGAGKLGKVLTNLSQTQTGRTNAQVPQPPTPEHQSSPAQGDSSATQWQKVGYGAIIGSILLGISIPMKWEIIYAGDESMHMTGWIMLLAAIGLFGAAVMQRKATTEQEAKKLSKPVMTCAGFAFLYAGYTIVTNWSIGDQSFAGMSAGIRNGPGVWLGLVGGIVALASQARFMPKQGTNTPESRHD